MKWKWFKKCAAVCLAICLAAVSPVCAFAFWEGDLGTYSVQSRLLGGVGVGEEDDASVVQDPSEPEMLAESALASLAAPKVTCTDCELQNGVYVLTEDKASMVLRDGASVDEIRIDAGQTLTLYLNGSKTNRIGSVSGGGRLVIDSTSTGKATLSGTISVAELSVNGGTLMGSGVITSADIQYTGGSLACSVAGSVKTGSAVLTRTELLVDADMPCMISDLSLNGNSVDDFIVWSDADGVIVLYLSDRAAAAFGVELLSCDEEEESLLAITTKTYDYAYAEFTEKKTASATVAVGADLTTAYGDAMNNKDIVSVSGTRSAVTSVSLKDYDDALEDLLTLTENSNGKGYKVSKTDIYELPQDTPYSYELTSVEVTDKFGFTHEMSGVVTLSVTRRELTPILILSESGKQVSRTNPVSKVYDGTVDVPDDLCEVSAFEESLAEGDTTAKILTNARQTLTYNDANVADARTVTLDVTLTGEWAEKYEVVSTDFPAKITKAALSAEKMEELGMKLVEPHVVERHYEWLKYQAVAGQEYAYEESASDDEWTAYDTDTVVTYIGTEDGEEVPLSAGTPYTIWTRFPESDNYLASDPVSVSKKTLRAPLTADTGDIRLTGVEADSTQPLNTELTLTATGTTFDSDYTPSLDDEKYVPYSWSLTETTVFDSQDSSQSFTITPTEAGTYTVVATFRKYVYDGEDWVRDPDGDASKSLTFKASATDGSGSSSSGSGSSSGSNSVTKTAAKTADTTPLLPLVCALLLAAGVLIAFAARRRREIRR